MMALERISPSSEEYAKYFQAALSRLSIHVKGNYHRVVPPLVHYFLKVSHSDVPRQLAQSIVVRCFSHGFLWWQERNGSADAFYSLQNAFLTVNETLEKGKERFVKELLYTVVRHTHLVHFLHGIAVEKTLPTTLALFDSTAYRHECACMLEKFLTRSSHRRIHTKIAPIIAQKQVRQQVHQILTNTSLSKHNCAHIEKGIVPPLTEWIDSLLRNLGSLFPIQRSSHESYRQLFKKYCVVHNGQSLVCTRPSYIAPDAWRGASDGQKYAWSSVDKREKDALSQALTARIRQCEKNIFSTIASKATQILYHPTSWVTYGIDQILLPWAHRKRKHYHFDWYNKGLLVYLSALFVHGIVSIWRLKIFQSLFSSLHPWVQKQEVRLMTSILGETRAVFEKKIYENVENFWNWLFDPDRFFIFIALIVTDTRQHLEDFYQRDYNKR